MQRVLCVGDGEREGEHDYNEAEGERQGARKSASETPRDVLFGQPRGDKQTHVGHIKRKTRSASKLASPEFESP